MYIGSSCNVEDRIYMHFYDLENGNHFNHHLQSAYNKYGDDTFITILLKTCKRKNLFYWEQAFIDDYNPSYNIRKIVEGPGKNSEESRHKMSLALKLRKERLGYTHSPETKRKISETLKGRISQMKGKKMSKESRHRMSLSKIGKPPPNKGKKMSKEFRDKISKAGIGRIPWNKGKKMSEEFRKNVSEGHKGHVPWNKGKVGYKICKISEETKKKISRTLRYRYSMMHSN